MAKNLSNNGIVLNQTIYPQHVSQSVDAFTGADNYDITISGSFTVTGSTSIEGELNVDGPTTIYGNVVVPNLTNTAQSDVVTYNPINGQFYYTASNAIAPATSSNAISASYSSTASYVENAQTASYVATASWAFNAVTASYIENAQTASYVALAQTASYVENAQTASYVNQSISASYSFTASYVENAQTASYVENAQTASYVETAQTASYVLSASYAVSSSIADSAISASYSTTSSFAQDAISASYAVSASHADLADTASYVENAQTASYVENAQTASYIENAQTASYVTLSQTASYVETSSYSNNSTTSSYALTASYLEGYISPFPFTGSAQITGSLGVTGSATINGDLVVNGTASFNVFHTIYNSSSIIYASGSTKFGDTSDDTHQFTGSLYISGSITADSFTGTASYATQALSSSYAITASYALNALSASYASTSSLSERTTQTDILAINQTGFTIEKGMVVRITGSNNSSDIPRITTASYETDHVSANTLGIATQQITNGSQGFVITEGVLTGIDTTNYISGQLVFLGAGGSITGSAPQAPLHTVRLGQVIRQQSNNGSIHIRIDNGYEIGELHDITDTTTTTSYGDMLIKSGSVWVNSKQLTGSYGLTGSLNATSFTGSLNGTSSYSIQAATASFVTLAQTASYVATAQTSSYVLSAVSASYSSTASYVNQLNQAVNISGSLNATGSVNIYKSGSSPLIISGSQGTLFEVTDAVSGSLWTIYTGSSPIFDVSSNRIMTLSGSATITGSLTVQNGITGSLFGTSSWAQNSNTASFVTLAQTASYVTNAVSASFSSTASYVNQLNQTVNISGSLNTTGSVSVYKSGSTVVTISGSVGPLLSITDNNSGPLLTVSTGSTNILVVDSSLVTTITGSLNVQNGVTSSLFGTSSWATNAVTASFITLAQTASYVALSQTASYVLNAVSASFASTSSYINQLNQAVYISGSINATGSVSIYQSGSTAFAVSGSNGPLFDVTDVISGPLFTVWTGSTPIIQVNSSLTTTITGSLSVQGGITGSLLGTASYSSQALSSSWAPSSPTFPYTGSALISGSLFITSSLSQTTSSISINLPSGSSSISYNVPLTKYKQFSYLTTTRPVYQDDYINLGYDSSGNDFEMDINTDPVSGRVQVHAFSTTATTVTATSDLIVASVTTDIYPNGISSDSRLEITVHAGLDPNYPFYKITAYRSNTTYGGNISVLVERFFPNY